MSALPQTPKALLNSLFVIFPQYRFNYNDYGPIYHGPPTFHSVLIEFNHFLRTETASLSAVQLSKFERFVGKAISKNGTLRKAFGRCLEPTLEKR